MADPYATRQPAPVADRPSPDSPFAAAVAARGGIAVATLAEAAACDPAVAAFIAVMRTDEGLLPPLARIDAAFALALLADSGEAGGGRPAAAGALAALRSAGAPIYLVKDGIVAGPAGREGAVEVGSTLIEAALDAALTGSATWERDPDFGYEVVASGSGLGRAEADALCPRFAYAAADRVYEHAELVADVKRGRRERLGSLTGLDPAVIAAAASPLEPTSTTWKD